MKTVNIIEQAKKVVINSNKYTIKIFRIVKITKNANLHINFQVIMLIGKNGKNIICNLYRRNSLHNYNNVFKNQSKGITYHINSNKIKIKCLCFNTRPDN